MTYKSPKIAKIEKIEATNQCFVFPHSLVSLYFVWINYEMLKVGMGNKDHLKLRKFRQFFLRFRLNSLVTAMI